MIRYLAPLLIASSATAHEISYPQFSGEIHFTRPNTPSFLEFIDDNLGKVVYINLLFTADFGLGISTEVEELCNSHFNFWDDGMENQNIFLPIDPANLENPAEEFEPSELNCEMVPIRFVDAELSLSSAGPGAHWFDIEGFFLVRAQSDRWPYLEIKSLPASAETWAQIKNK